MSFFGPDFLQFFIDLAPNNHKEWFDENRERYENSVREPFKAFVTHLIGRVAETDKAFKGLEAKDCIFRINRDIRFSKDKTPYKMMVSAVIAPGGKKSKAINGIYFELGPEFVSVYAGVYEADKNEVSDIRHGIAANLSKFDKLKNDPAFLKTYGEILGEKNKILPADLKEAAQKEPLIFNKNWYFRTQFPAELLLTDKLETTLLHCLEVSQPLQRFFNSCIQ